eukprot:CAMPEP_0177701992 /NCGR_PEP_ID=MMETSP0484_2-20121128/6904_1 /TAXON_ID=354590 /ORGANISM="Rhodomonas lens, Strain RHODO" /LENGTH=492 /DNA_ID=CAMNT_0019213257 /DNA_START=187 /DNA_END=1666 /DNA_ORIENTATION=-
MSNHAGLLTLDGPLIRRIIQPGWILAGVMTCKTLRDELLENVTEIHIRAGDRCVELEDLDVFFSRWNREMKMSLTISGQGEKLAGFFGRLVKATKCSVVSSLRVRAKLDCEQVVILSGQLPCFSLTTFDMTQTRLLNSESWVCLLSGLKQCKGLQILNVGQCSIGRTEAAVEISQTLLHLPNLTSLDLHSNDLAAPDLAAVTTALGRCERLTSLNLGWNNLNMAMSHQLASALPAYTSLRCLNIMYTDVNPARLTVILTGLQRSRTLTELILPINNSIGNEGARSLGASLQGGWTQLVSLSAHSCAIGDEGMTGLAAGLAHHPALTKLDVMSNRFREAGATALAGALRTLPALETLRCAQNTIGDAGLRAVLSGLDACLNLKTLLLPMGAGGDGYTAAGARAAMEWQRAGCFGQAFVQSWTRMYEQLRRERQADAVFTWEVLAWRALRGWRLECYEREWLPGDDLTEWCALLTFDAAANVLKTSGGAWGEAP